MTFPTRGGIPSPAAPGGEGSHFALDNLALTAPVPEPANAALMLAALGLVGVAVRRRKA